MRDTKISLDESDFRQIQRYADSNPSHNFKLTLVQQPQTGKAVSSNLRARGLKWPIEPPPVLELTSPEKDSQKWLYIHNPNWFCVAALITIEATTSKGKSNNKKEAKDGLRDNLTGLLASSLHKVKNPEDRNEHGYFVFGDLNVRDQGRYKLEFTLFEMRRYESQVYAAKIDSVTSDTFEVLPPKSNPAAKDSTKLSKVLSESGVKIRLRKESTNKRKGQSFNWSASATDNFHYNTGRGPQASLAPMNNFANMSMPPPSNQNMRFARNSGEDITRRVSVIQNDSNTPLMTQPYMTSPLNTQHFVGNQGYNFNTPTSAHPSQYDSNVSPMTTQQAHFPPSVRDGVSYSGQLPLQQTQATSQPWSFPGHGTFRPETSYEQPHIFGGHQLPDPRINFERVDSGYSSHGRSSMSQMESGALDAFSARVPPYGQTNLPALPMPRTEAMPQQDWPIATGMQNFASYNPMGSGRQIELENGSSLPVDYHFSAGSSSMYGQPPLPPSSSQS